LREGGCGKQKQTGEELHKKWLDSL